MDSCIVAIRAVRMHMHTVYVQREGSDTMDFLRRDSESWQDSRLDSKDSCLPNKAIHIT